MARKRPLAIETNGKATSLSPWIPDKDGKKMQANES